MRHNQNVRHARGRRGNNGNQGNHGNHGNHGNNHNNNGGRRMNPRVQTFDSNGPDVRIRGNAYQITEKYLGLARDANSGGDRILAESYYQHAEHYQRLINEMEAEMNAAGNARNDQPVPGEGPQPDVRGADENRQDDDGADMNDLDQGFLVGDRRKAAQTGTDEEDDAVETTVAPHGNGRQASVAASGRQSPAAVAAREAETA